jgi:membrane protease YdiL (CAAX protease family)
MILTHLASATGRWTALAVQAVGFGPLNLHGYAQGLIGVGLTSGYGLLLGWLRLGTGGLLAGWVSHVLADSMIFVFILQAAVHPQ